MPDNQPSQEHAIRAAIHLAAVVDSSDDAIVSKNLAGIIQSWNQAAERIFGYTAQEAIGQSILLIIPPSLHSEEAYILEQLRAGHRIQNYETTRRRKDGQLITISLTVSPIRDPEGRIVGASKIARDITQHKAVALAAWEAQQRLTVTLQSIGDAVVATNAEGRVTFINRVAASLMGYTDHDILGRSLDEVFHVIHEDTRHRIPSPVHDVLQTRQPVRLSNNTVLVRPDGTQVPIDDSAAPIVDAAGGLYGVVLVFHDVTERRQARRQAAWLSAIIASSDDAIISKDRRGIVTTWNQGAERIFGYRADEIVGHPITMIIPSERHHEEAHILAKLARGERVDHFETVRQKKDASLCDISLTVSPIKDEEGRVIGASKVARDITAQKAAQKTIHEAQERWQVTLASIGDAVIATDGSATITFANSVALELLQRSAAQVLGRPLNEAFIIVNEETRRPVNNPVDRVIEEGIVFGLANHTVLIRPNGTEVPIDDCAAPIRDDHGTLIGVVLVFRDVTEQKQAERHLAQWNVELEKRVAERTAELVQSQERLRALASQLNLVEQRERRRLATDLHDYLAQLLALGRMKIGQLRRHSGRLEDAETVLNDMDRLKKTVCVIPAR